VAPLPAFRALVVDDNALNRRVARALLEKLGGVVLEAHDGQAALEVAARETLDVILMDLQMPVLDGLEATRGLVARGDRTPIIGLTASAGPDTAAECRAAGMVGCLSKPVQLEVLQLELSQALAARVRAA
jgi:CheY-like chemotaxis protein